MSKQWKYMTTPEYIETQNKFNQYYTEKVLPILQSLEKTRKRYFYIFMLIIIALIVWIGFIATNIQDVISGSSQTQGHGFYGLLGCLAILVLCWPMLSYYRRSKESMLPILAEFFGEFSYLYNSELPLDLMDESMLFRDKGVMRGEDCFSGTYQNVAVQIMEYHRFKQEKRYNEEYQRREKVYVSKDRGLIFYAEMNKSFEGKTVVVKDKGWLNIITKYQNLQRVGLESPEFEKKFEVYSDNQIEARYILTPIMLEYMEKLQDTFSKIEFSFFRQHVMIKIETKKNTFECSNFFRSVINKKRIAQNFDELYLLFSIITTLRLNQKQVQMQIN